MNDDEKARLAEWQKKKDELDQKLIKSWKQRLSTLQAEVFSIKIKFEEDLLQMFKKRLFYEARIYEQELYIIRLVIMLSDVTQTSRNVEKYSAERQRLEIEFTEKTDMFSKVLDKLEEFEQRIKVDSQEIPRHDAEVTKWATDEQLRPQMIKDFVKKGKATALVKVSDVERL